MSPSTLAASRSKPKRHTPSRCAKSKGGKSFKHFSIVDKLPVDVDAKDWASDGSATSVEGDDQFSVLSESKMISESLGTFEWVSVTFSVLEATIFDGVVVCPGCRGGVCDRILQDLDASEYFTKICFCPHTCLPLPDPEDRDSEFQDTLGHGSLLLKHQYMGMDCERDMATIPSLSVSSS
jgi:hypothetical protein